MRWALALIMVACSAPTTPREEACAAWARAGCECAAAAQGVRVGPVWGTQEDVDAWFEECQAVLVGDEDGGCIGLSNPVLIDPLPRNVHTADVDACIAEVAAVTECLGDDPAESIEDREGRCGRRACEVPTQVGNACDWTCNWEHPDLGSLCPIF